MLPLLKRFVFPDEEDIKHGGSSKRHDNKISHNKCTLEVKQNTNFPVTKLKLKQEEHA